jgi:hypothetical protein
MDRNFNLYDLFGYLIPGALALVGTFIPLLYLGWVEAPPSAWTTTLVGIPLAYAYGHLVHQIGRMIFHAIGGWLGTEHFSERLIDGSQDYDQFSDDFKRSLLDLIARFFNVSVPSPDEIGGDASQRRRIAFQLCYDYVIQQGIGTHTDNFCAIRGFYRNTAVGVVTSAFMFTLLAFNSAPTLCTTIYLFCAIWLTAFLLVFLFYRGYYQFSERFVTSVYRSFYVGTRDGAGEMRP